MSDEEPSIKKAVHKQETFWTPTRILMLFFFIIGIVVGYAGEKYVLHPFFAGGTDALSKCQKDSRLLSENLDACLRGEIPTANPGG
jgi:hypothetical protein